MILRKAYSLLVFRRLTMTCVLSLLLFQPIFAGSIEECTSLFKSGISDLLQSASPSYKINVLSRKLSNGRVQKITLVGEFHNKSKEVSIVGENLVNAFQYRALEFPESESKRVGDEKAMRAAATLERFYERFNFAGSTMDRALKNTETEQGPAKNFFIDTAIEKNPWSKIAVARLYAILLSAGMIPFLAGSEIPQWAELPSLIFVAHSLYSSFDVFAGHALDKFKDKKWFRYAFNLYYGLLVKRNEVMVENLLAILNENPEIENILVIVGRYHNQGIVELLSQRGFREI